MMVTGHQGVKQDHIMMLPPSYFTTGMISAFMLVRCAQTGLHKNKVLTPIRVDLSN